jgi:hypothetical protein
VGSRADRVDCVAFLVRQASNSRHQHRSYVFQGRYKAVPVAGEAAADEDYFKSLLDALKLGHHRRGRNAYLS